MAAIQSVDVGRNPHVSAGPAPIRLQNRHALACGPLQPGEKPHAHAWRFCSHTMQPQKAYVRITVSRGMHHKSTLTVWNLRCCSTVSTQEMTWRGCCKGVLHVFDAAVLSRVRKRSLRERRREGGPLWIAGFLDT